MSKVYIQSSSLISALSSSDNIHSSNVRHVNINISGIAHSFPYYLIHNNENTKGIERLYSITRRVVEQAINDANLSEEDLAETALFVGSTSFSIFISEQRYQDELKGNADASPIGLTAYEELSNFIRNTFLPHSNSFTYHTACTSSANALLHAKKMIESKKIKHALIVGLEFFNETTLLGFHSLNLISKSKIQPFGAHRDGIILGEGCSAIVLGAKKPDIKNPLYILGGSTMTDIDSMTTPSSDGSSIISVIEQAITNAGIDKADISAIKLHATATLANDSAEAIAVKHCFSQGIPQLIALKPAIGHTLGACGSNELAIICAYLKQQQLPGQPYPYDKELSLGLHIEEQNFASDTCTLLLNHFGFGGNNTVLVVSNR